MILLFVESNVPNNIRNITETESAFTYLFVCTATIAFWFSLDFLGMLLTQKKLTLSIISLHSLIPTAIS